MRGTALIEEITALAFALQRVKPTACFGVEVAVAFDRADEASLRRSVGMPGYIHAVTGSFIQRKVTDLLYQPGDRVVVRADLINGQRYYMNDGSASNTAVREMVKMAGQIVTIRTANRQYTIEEDSWHWVDGMFAGLADEIWCGDATLEIDDAEWSRFFSSWQINSVS